MRGGRYCVRGHDLWIDGRDTWGHCSTCSRINASRVRDRNRERIDAYKLARGCMACGYRKNARALELHHRDPTTKLVAPARMKHRSWDAFLVEAAKCDVLCANCHRELHTG